jgi:hypothetical protein
MITWMRRLLARLRRPRGRVTTPVSELRPTATVPPPDYLYTVIVEDAVAVEGLPGQDEQTHPFAKEGRPVTVDEDIDLGGGRLVTVVEIVQEAAPGVRAGSIRAKPAARR